MKAKVAAANSALASDPLRRYRTKRNFAKTPEPSGEIGAGSAELAFVIQKHAATRLHYDLRLELDGVMVSWAVPKGPSFDPKDKRIAMHVEDHPISYNAFEGTIPPKQYGAGSVIIWDRGTWEPIGDARKGLEDGKLVFRLRGQKLAGLWELVRIRKPGERQDPWLLFKKQDAYARSKVEYDVVTALPDSVVAKPLGPVSLPASSRGVVFTAKRPAELAGAVKAPLPAKLAPQLATPTQSIPAGDWIYEIKFDGYRLLARIDGKSVRLFTRRGHDWTQKMPQLAADLSGLNVSSAWLDGEIVVIGNDGTPDFNALQNAFQRSQASGIEFFLFDIPYFEGYDLRRVALRERRALLKRVLDEHPAEHVRFSADFDADPLSILRSAEKMKLEGLIAKRADAPYLSERSATWLKIKCRQRQEFVIGGYCDRGGEASSAEIGSLLLGVYDADRSLKFVGGVGTGWSAKTAADLKTRLAPLRSATSPFASSQAVKRSRWARRAAGAERWVKPQLVAEVSFTGWTPDDQVRHAKFEGLRLDKPAHEVKREASSVIRAEDLAAAASRRVASTKVTHPERVIDPSTGLTKLDLVRYYESVAQWMVPHLKGRPCSLVRGPSGINATLFYQKHANTLRIAGIKALDPSFWPGHEALLEVPNARAIVGAAQMNVIEFHTWNAKTRSIDTPDRLIFDLDPGERVGWNRVQEAALLVRGFLQELDLEAWLKTSGGKGLHLVVPIAARYDWDTARDFSEAVVQQLARVVSDRFVAKSGAQNRVGRIYIDYVRNSHGATTVAAYSARARPGLGVSMPIPWDKLDALKSGAQWTIATAREHLSFHSNDPWSAYWDAKQPLARAMKLLKFKPKSPC